MPSYLSVRGRKMTRTIMFGCHKGGVGKSGGVVQTAAALARRGLDVLVVDMDSQANASRMLGAAWNPSNPTATVSEAIVANQKGAAEGAVVPCGWVNDGGEPTNEASHIDVLPSRFDLGNREGEAGQVGAVRRLRKALTGWTDEYDFVLIDTPPSLGHLVQMSMAAADAVVVVSQPEYSSAEAAIRTADFVAQHADDLGNPELHVAGILVNMYRGTAEHESQLEGFRDRFGPLLWDLRTTEEIPGFGDRELSPSFVPLWSIFSDADSYAASLSDVPPARKKKQAIALYDAVATRIITHFDAQESAA